MPDSTTSRLATARVPLVIGAVVIGGLIGYAGMVGFGGMKAAGGDPTCRAAAGRIAGGGAIERVNADISDQCAHQHRSGNERDPAPRGRLGRGDFGHIVCHPVSVMAMQSRNRRGDGRGLVNSEVVSKRS